MASFAQQKPEGGYRFISAALLYKVWCSYNSERIRLYDVRLWCAAQEMVARRCQLAVGQQPVYRYDELRQLVGGGGGIPTALARLHSSGLLMWEATAVTFPSP